MKRRLVAVVAADVVGYSRLMADDEAGTLNALKAHRRASIDPKIEAHHGRIVKTTGDGMLLEFHSIVDAVCCAVEIQQATSQQNAGLPSERRLELRVGINLGDVILDGDDLYGDGVNVAARLEALAEPGSIYLSNTAYEHVRGKVDFAFDDLGDHALKNIATPIRVYRVRRGVQGAEQTGSTRPALALPDRPSIAVLPFANMSGDSDQYFVDGITEDVTTTLSKWRWFFVIARNSSFIYKDRAVDVKQVGRELGVRYVLEGSVRRAANRVRITAQLVDAINGSHVWAEKFDRELVDIFALQDEITERIATAIDPAMRLIETQRAIREPAIDAWDHFLRGSFSFYKYEKHSNEEARRHFAKAIELDPTFALAHAQLARTHYFDAWMNWADMPERSYETAYRLAATAVMLDGMEAVAHSALAITALFARHYDAALRAGHRAIELNPNYQYGHSSYGHALAFVGRPVEAIQCLQTALRLSPNDPMAWAFYGTLALAHYDSRCYEAAGDAARRALAIRREHLRGFAVLVASLAQLGRSQDVEDERARMQDVMPDLDLRQLTAPFPFRDGAGLNHLLDGLRKAGWEDAA